MSNTLKPSILALALALAGAAAAASPAEAAGEAAAAETLFHDGLKLVQQGRFKEACGKFEASHRQDPTWSALIQMGDCYQKLGRTASAWAAYREASDFAHNRGDRAREKFANLRSAPLEPRLARLVIVVDADGDVRDYEVRRDGQRVDPGILGTPIPVDPGEYEIDARGPDVHDWHSKVRVEVPGEQVTERITLRRAARPASPPLVQPAATPAVDETPAPDPRRELFFGAETGLGYLSTSNGDLDASVHGLTLHTRLLAGYAVGRWVGLGGLTLDRAADPTLTYHGEDASGGGLTLSAFSLVAGAGVRPTPALLLGALFQLTKVSVSAAGADLSSSFGPGFEALAMLDVMRHGPWGLALAARAGMANVSVMGTSWTAYTVGVGVAGTYQ
jgi:hypothetical protein